MKLALVCTEKLPVPPVRGGAIQTYIDGVLPYLAARHQVTVICRSDPALPDYEQLTYPLPTRETGPLPGAATQSWVGGPTMGHPVRFIRVDPTDYVANVQQVLRADRWDTVELFNRPAWVMRLADAAPGARFVLSMHNDMFGYHRLPEPDGRRVLERVDAVAAISEYIRSEIARLHPGFEGKMQTIRSGVDLEAFCPGPPRADLLRRYRLLRPGTEHPAIGPASEWEEGAVAPASFPLAAGFAQRRPVILAVGRLSAKKGAHVLIAAMPQILQSHPDAVLLLVGSRWYGKDEEDDYTRAVRRQAAPLADSIQFTGYVPYHRMPDIFRLGDLFVCSSQWQEPLARVHYEAMATGLATVTTARGGNAEVITDGENGRLINTPDDPAAFARVITELLDRPDLCRSMGERGRAFVEANHSWARVAGALLPVLEGR